jgi:hypothetical protein
MDASEEERTAFLDRLLELNVPVLSRGSRRLSKVLTGEKPIESLLEPSGGHVQHQPLQPLQLISAGAGVGETTGIRTEELSIQETLRRALLELLEEHRQQGTLPTSARFLYYELVARGIISKEKHGLGRTDSPHVEGLNHAPQTGGSALGLDRRRDPFRKGLPGVRLD